MKFLLKHKFISSYISITLILFLLRIFVFAGNFGGVEHDSGWYLGVARNLAENGVYASFTNTVSVDGIGAFPSIHGRYSVQDSQGNSYFPGGVTVGPGYIFPEGIILKIFGVGWWQFRLWPFFIFSLLLASVFIFVYLIGGFFALIIFQIWLFIIPQFYIAFSYEAFSETIAFFYLFFSFLFYQLSVRKKSFRFLVLAGLFYSFSILTKNLFILPGLVFIPIFLKEIINCKRKKVVIFRWIFFLIALIIPIASFELYKYVALVSKFGIVGWEAINKDIAITFQQNGSGLSNLYSNATNYNFIVEKLNIWMDVGIAYPLLFWILLLSSPFVVLKLIKPNFKKILVILYGAMFISFIWYILISPTGWGRHIWQGIILGLMLISIFLGVLIKNVITKKKFSFLFFIFLVSILFFRLSSLDFNFWLGQDDILKWRTNRFIRGLEGFPSTPILSLKDQKEVLNYFEKNIKPDKKIFYVGWFLNSEMSAITGRVFFPLDRYLINQKQESYLIMGPYQKGIWSLMPTGYLPLKVSQLCEKVVLNNNSYTLCRLKKNLVYNNLPYQ